MKATATVIFALFLVMSSLGSPRAAALRSNVSVESEFIRLGDIFAAAGAREDVIVAGAPAPGRKEIFTARRLWAIAREHDLDWSPASRYDRVTVERAGRPIELGEILERVKEALVSAGVPADHEVRLTSNKLSLFAALGGEPPFTVRNARYDARTGRFSAVIVVPTGSRSAQRTQVTGKAYAMIEVPVLNRRMRRNETISRDDLDILQMRESRVGRNAILDVGRIVGQNPRRLLKAGTPLRPGDLRRPIVVAKGSLVTLVMRTRNMILTAKGRATHDAAMGEAVRVVNTRSKTAVEGIVEAPNRVIITAPGAIN